MTIHVRRLFVQKYSGLFTQERGAGVLVTAKLTGEGVGQSIDVTIPSVNAVEFADASKGRVSVPLEYEIAQYLRLKQDKGTYYGIHLGINLAKTRGKSTFGEVFDLAGKALGQVKIPAVRYVDMASQCLKFANDAIDTNVKNNSGAVPFANIALAFNNGAEPNLDKSQAAGKERTGGFGVLLSTGDPEKLLPVKDSEKQHCLSYTSGTTYDITAAKRNADGSCPVQGAFRAITNDNVFFIVRAQTVGAPKILGSEDSRRRCEFYGLPANACGTTFT